MKVNFNVPFTNYKGQETGEMISDKISEVLFSAGMQNDQISPEEKYRSYKLCRRIGNSDGEVEITSEDAVLIKEVCAIYLVAGGYGQIVELIEGGE